MARPFDPVMPPPLDQQSGSTFPRLVELMQRLLAPDGCPWDREQSFATLRRYVLEEACEVIDAIDGGNRRELCGELGDLMLQIVFQAELARAEGAFGPDDVVAAICDKLVRRHPHVFADASVDGVDDVLQNWERIKAAERKTSGHGGVLSGVPRSLPALTRAQRIGEKVARVGFDWPDQRGSRAKVEEELRELDEALASGDADSAEAELGDVLFALVNLARHAGIDAEAALGRTIGKFTRRFEHVEQRVVTQHGGWPGGKDPLSLPELDGYWEEAKRVEAGVEARVEPGEPVAPGAPAEGTQADPQAP
ncbi:nucleoside triphosphate pyrophosphohydrolase [Chondromyces apiculatus]|nr:nucleoside triphosphate pyrophosphohydrolase [Chondromyces apiculatus]